MLYNSILGLAAISMASASAILPRAGCGEGEQKICYGVHGGQSQDVDPEDVQYVAEYLRSLGKDNEGMDKFWTMPKSIDCAEWSLPVYNAGTVLALAKHTNNRVQSSILYEDLAAAIDGGKNSADKGQNELMGCGKKGGQMGVKANTSNPLYSSDEYKKTGSKPEGIVIKIVKAPSN